MGSARAESLTGLTRYDVRGREAGDVLVGAVAFGLDNHLADCGDVRILALAIVQFGVQVDGLAQAIVGEHLANVFRVVFHLFRVAENQLVAFGALLGGTVVIEQLFALPGLGKRLIDAINQRDIIVIQGITVFIAAMYVIINTIVDLLYLVVDPRIRKG